MKMKLSPKLLVGVALLSVAVATAVWWLTDRDPSVCDTIGDYRIAGELEHAERAARTCLAEHPDHPEALAQLSRIHGMQGRDKLALHRIESAIDAAAGTPSEYALWHARLLERIGDYDAARSLLDDIDPDRVDPDELRRLREALDPARLACETIRQLRIDGEFEAAKRAAQRCLRHDPDHVDAKIELARLLAIQQRHQVALAQLQEALAQLDDPPADLLLFENRLHDWVHDDESTPEFTEWLDLDRFNADAVERLGEAVRAGDDTPPRVCRAIREYRLDERVDRAQRAAEQCLQNQPEDFDVLVELSRVLAMHQRYDEAAELLDEALDGVEEPPAEVLLWQARLSYWQQQHKAALRLLDQIDETQLDSDEIARLRDSIQRALDATPEVCAQAAEYRLDDRLDEAENAAQRCIAKRPGDLQAQVELSRILALQKHFDEALNWIDAATAEAEPPAGEHLLWHARLLHWRGDHEQALERLRDIDETEVDADKFARLQQAIKRAIEAPPPVCAKIAEHRLDGDLEIAEQAARECLDEHPGHAEAHLELSRIRAMQQRFQAAVEQLQLAREHTGDRPEYLLWGARLSFWMDHLQQARALLRQLDPEEVDAGDIGQLLEAVARAEALEQMRARRKRPAYHGEMALMDSPDRSTGWHTRHGIAGYLADGLFVQFDVDVIRRVMSDDTPLVDVLADAAARFDLGERLRLEVGGGLAPIAQFSPRWNLHVEPGVQLTEDLETKLRLRRVQFDEQGVNLVTPSVLWNIGSFVIDARYYHGVEPDDRNAHAVATRLIYAPVPSVQVSLGGSLGNKADYLEGYRHNPQRAVQGDVGMQLELTDSVDVTGEFSYRNELLDGDTFQLLRTTGGIRVRF